MGPPARSPAELLEGPPGVSLTGLAGPPGVSSAGALGWSPVLW
ncbi:hypothetical protein [Nonomuraea aridisoli]|nr:hypothetical protein [Nonomuraea aridisoli]